MVDGGRLEGFRVNGGKERGSREGGIKRRMALESGKGICAGMSKEKNKATFEKHERIGSVEEPVHPDCGLRLLLSFALSSCSPPVRAPPPDPTENLTPQPPFEKKCGFVVEIRPAGALRREGSIDRIGRSMPIVDAMHINRFAGGVEGTWRSHCHGFAS